VKPKLILVLTLIVLLPLTALGWLGLRVATQEREVTANRLREALNGRLRDINAVILRAVGERETGLLRVLDRSAFAPGELREVVRATPLIQALFVLDPDGNRLHPPPDGPLTSAEQEFLERSGQVWRDKQVFFGSADAAGKAVSHGWYTWYWGNGVNIVFWVRTATGHVIGAACDRTRLLADIVGELPDSDAAVTAPQYSFGSAAAAANLREGRIALVGGDGAAIYQWGLYEPSEGELPQVRLDLAPPLDSWSLLYYTPAPAGQGRIGGSLLLNLVAGLGALVLALIGLAAYFYRESTRGMREAAARVSFVNQVSHELKTPLTNIRMYAELLERSIPEGDAKATRHLDIIVSESQRLSRLIGNVLTFARRQNDKLTLHPADGSIDRCIEFVLGHFQAALEARGVRTRFDAGAGALVRFDRDALEQILGNLFSNVEKYAAGGGWMEVASRQQGDTTTITVRDRGPGIPKGQEERIFQPFQRLSDKLSDGTAGTGIGLTIARELARRHEGDLRVVAMTEGACFELHLRTPAAQAEQPA
jgi:signal transduction histidine kinase